VQAINDRIGEASVQYRSFGRLDWKPSAVGFGAMRLPTIDNDPAKIDEAESTRMLRYAVHHGVNYVDTAYPYQRENSERFLGHALQDGYRERIKLATKMPCWKIEEADDFDRVLDEQLEKLQADYIDFYLLHGLNSKRWADMHSLNVLLWLCLLRKVCSLRQSPRL
jgi:predicted aldo/keto reductase-like oxidoreductase